MIRKSNSYKIFLSFSSSANLCISGQTPKLSVSQAVTLAPAAHGAEYTKWDSELFTWSLAWPRAPHRNRAGLSSPIDQALSLTAFYAWRNNPWQHSRSTSSHFCLVLVYVVVLPGISSRGWATWPLTLVLPGPHAVFLMLCRKFLRTKAKHHQLLNRCSLLGPAKPVHFLIIFVFRWSPSLLAQCLSDILWKPLSRWCPPSWISPSWVRLVSRKAKQ